MKDDTPRSYQFGKIVEPAVGAGFSKYWSYHLKAYGRQLFTDAVQAHPDDLMADPWESKNSDE